MHKAPEQKYRKKTCPRCKGEGVIVMKQKRSLSQNKYYWGVVINSIAVEIGEDADTVHSLMAIKFNSNKKKLPDQSINFIPGSTSKLTTKEFVNYTANIRRWASEYLNVLIPKPNEADDEHWMKLEEQYYNMTSQY